MLIDSLGRNLTGIKGTTVVPFPGYTVGQLADAISCGRVQVAGAQAILIHVGTNNIPPLRRPAPGQPPLMSIDAVVREFRELIRTVRQFNPTCPLVMSAILPRPVDHLHTWYRVEQINAGLKNFCDPLKQVFFNPTYRFFIKFGRPVEDYYAQRDKLHLSGSGLLRLQQAFQQALSDANLTKGNHWRRKPSSGPVIL